MITSTWSEMSIYCDSNKKEKADFTIRDAVDRFLQRLELHSINCEDSIIETNIVRNMIYVLMDEMGDDTYLKNQPDPPVFKYWTRPPRK